MEKVIIYKYLAGKATEKDRKELLAWLKASEDNRKFLSEAKVLWQVRKSSISENIQNINIDASLDHVNKQIDSISGRQKIHINNRALQLAACVAAIALLLFGVTSLLNIRFTPRTELLIVNENRNGSNGVKTLFLPDSTKVWLDEGSSLSYSGAYNKEKRVVRLKGMAFFDVVKDKTKPFIVQFDSCAIEVLGTSFCVNTNAGRSLTETILMHGSVRLIDRVGKNIALLYPGEQLLYSSNDRKVEIHEVDVNTLTSWRFGLVTLSDMPIQDIVRYLEDIYHIKVATDISSILEHRYNFSFKRAKGPQRALEQLSFITGIPIRISSEK